MGLLDGDAVKNILGAAMSPLYASATFHPVTLLDDGEGGWVPSTGSVPVKAQENTLKEEARLRSGYSDLESQIFILAKGFEYEPKSGDKINYKGTIFAVVRAELDPGRSHWICRCQRTTLTEEELAGST